MFSLRHQIQNANELFEVVSLRGPEFVGLKERNNLASQFRCRPHTKAIKLFSVIVIAAIDKDSSAFEELLQIMESLQAFLSLGYDELRERLASQ